MDYSRRSALRICLGTLTFGTAGCVTQSTPSTSAPKSSNECTVDPISESSALNSNLRRDLPEKPEEFSQETVREFTTQYEEAIIWNNRYQDHTESLHIEVSERNISSVQDGHKVILDVEVHERSTDDSIGSTAWTAVYFINESVVKRAQDHGGVPPEKEPDRILVCW